MTRFTIGDTLYKYIAYYCEHYTNGAVYSNSFNTELERARFLNTHGIKKYVLWKKECWDNDNKALIEKNIPFIPVSMSKKDFNELVWEYGAFGTKVLEDFNEKQSTIVACAWRDFCRTDDEDDIEKWRYNFMTEGVCNG